MVSQWHWPAACILRSILTGFVDLFLIGWSTLDAFTPLLWIALVPTDDANSCGDLRSLRVNVISKNRDKKGIDYLSLFHCLLSNWSVPHIRVNRCFYTILHFLKVSSLICWFLFLFQLLLRVYVQHQSSIITLVGLEVKLDLVEHKEALFLLKQATGTDQVSKEFDFYSKHWDSEPHSSCLSDLHARIHTPLTYPSFPYLFLPSLPSFLLFPAVG